VVQVEAASVVSMSIGPSYAGQHPNSGGAFSQAFGETADALVT